MAVSGAANSDTFKVTTPSDAEIRMTRLFDAPRQLVFEAMTQARAREAVVGQLGEAIRYRCARLTFAPAARGASSTATPKGEAVFYGVYREIAPPERVVFTEIFAPFPDAESVVTVRAHRGGRQDAADRDRALSVAGGARHGAEDRHGAGRRDQLRPARGSRSRADCVKQRPSSHPAATTPVMSRKSLVFGLCHWSLVKARD